MRRPSNPVHGAQFERRHRRLELLAASVEEDIQSAARQSGGADLQRLLPIQRCALRIGRQNDNIIFNAKKRKMKSNCFLYNVFFCFIYHIQFLSLLELKQRE